MSGVDKTRDELFAEYFEDREGSVQVAEHAYRQGWKDRATYTVVPAAPTQGADARPVAIYQREQFEAHWCRDVPAMYRVAALAEIKACRDEERYKRDEIQWAWESWQAAIATRDAAPSDAISDGANPKDVK